MMAAPWSGTFSVPSWIGRKILSDHGPEQHILQCPIDGSASAGTRLDRDVSPRSTDTRSSLTASCGRGWAGDGSLVAVSSFRLQ